MGLVRLAHLADLDLDSIRDFIAQQNPRAANDVLDLLFKTLERLADEREVQLKDLSFDELDELWREAKVAAQ